MRVGSLFVNVPCLLPNDATCGKSCSTIHTFSKMEEVAIQNGDCTRCAARLVREPGSWQRVGPDEWCSLVVGLEGTSAVQTRCGGKG